MFETIIYRKSELKVNVRNNEFRGWRDFDPYVGTVQYCTRAVPVGTDPNVGTVPCRFVQYSTVLYMYFTHRYIVRSQTCCLTAIIFGKCQR